MTSIYFCDIIKAYQTKSVVKNKNFANPLISFVFNQGVVWIRQAIGLFNLAPSGDVITNLNITANTFAPARMAA